VINKNLKKLKKKYKNMCGLTLIEVVLYTSIFSFIMTGFVMLSWILSDSNTKTSADADTLIEEFRILEATLIKSMYEK